jgi:predicted metal-binding membrane protein
MRQQVGGRRLSRDQSIVAVALAILAVLAWLYTVLLSGSLIGLDLHGLMAMPRQGEWTLIDLVLTFLMWAVMMVAMMIPSAMPMILLFTAVEERRKAGGALARTAVFVSGYAAAWVGFSLLATLAQWGLHDAAMLGNTMGRLIPWAGAAALAFAGLYQFSPLKRTCLHHCSSPLEFLAAHWRPGDEGALRMGIQHGGYCLGCCWAFMLVLFAVGVMNTLWVALIAIFVLLEKLVPGRDRLRVVLGAALLLWSAIVATASL